MDWTVMIAVCAAVLAVILAWKMWKLKRDVYEFADALDRNLDAVIRGEEPEEVQGMEDSLPGKVNEKLHRVNHILEGKELEARQNREMMKELISDISHQTKTPVANQKIYLELLKSRPLPDDAGEFVEKLEHQTDKLEFLFESMVKMSRLETGVIQIRKEDSDLMETIGQAVSAVVPTAEKKRIRLSVETDRASRGQWGKIYTGGRMHNCSDQAKRDLYGNTCAGYGERDSCGAPGTDIHPFLPGTGSA